MAFFVKLTLNIFLISSFSVVENDEAVRLCQILQTKVNWTIRLGAPPQRGRPRLSCQSVQQPWCWWTWAMHNWQQPRQLQQPLPHHPHPQPPKNNISNEWCNFCNTIHKIVHKVCPQLVNCQCITRFWHIFLESVLHLSFLQYMIHILFKIHH